MFDMRPEVGVGVLKCDTATIALGVLIFSTIYCMATGLTFVRSDYFANKLKFEERKPLKKWCRQWSCDEVWYDDDQNWKGPPRHDLLNVPSKEKEWHELHKQQLRNSNPCPIVFLGDSITEGWYQDPFSRVRNTKPREKNFKLFQATFGDNAHIFAIGGDRIHELGWRLTNGLQSTLEECKPKKLLLLIGTNDFGAGEDFDVVRKEYELFLFQIQKALPSTSIFLLPLMPRSTLMRGDSFAWDDSEPYYEDLTRFNEFLESLSPPKIHCNSLFFQNGVISREIFYDFLHPSERGYEIWAQCLSKALQ